MIKSAINSIILQIAMQCTIVRPSRHQNEWLNERNQWITDAFLST